MVITSVRTRAVAFAAAVAVLLAATPAADASTVAGRGPGAGASCGPDASLLGFSDALDKTTFQGTQIAGLSALALVGCGSLAVFAAGLARRHVERRGAPKPHAPPMPSTPKPERCPSDVADESTISDDPAQASAYMAAPGPRR